MAANMDTTGTFEIAKCFAEHGMFVCIHKHYSIDEWKTFAKNNKVYFYYSQGEFREKISEINPEIFPGNFKFQKLHH